MSAGTQPCPTCKGNVILWVLFHRGQECPTCKSAGVVPAPPVEIGDVNPDRPIHEVTP